MAKNKNDLINEGFVHVSNDGTIEIWAKETGYLDVVNYVYYDEKFGKCGSINVTSLGQIKLFADMYNALNKNQV